MYLLVSTLIGHLWDGGNGSATNENVFASVRLMANAIVISSRIESNWRSKWLRNQRRRQSSVENIRPPTSNYWRRIRKLKRQCQNSRSWWNDPKVRWGRRH